MQQQIRFCRSFDGTRIAFAVTGKGAPDVAPLVRAPHWLTHLEYEWQSPIWRRWLTALSAGRSLVRMDERGCGLTDRGVDTILRNHITSVFDKIGVESRAIVKAREQGVGQRS